jgi:Uma2 family endonuclease
MDYTQFYILSNLLNKFRSIDADGELISEGDVFFVENHRRPDIAYFTTKQIDAAADGVNPNAEFIIEVISNTDAINRVNKKMQNYRAAAVKVVWHIFPQTKEIHIYCGDSLKTVYIKSGDEICSAEPVLPDFKMSVNDVFKRKNEENA